MWMNGCLFVMLYHTLPLCVGMKGVAAPTQTMKDHELGEDVILFEKEEIKTKE
jgi:hypothetical protein